MKGTHLYIKYFYVVGTILFGLMTPSVFAQTDSSNVYDLTEYNFFDDQVASLDGSWNFYWQELISPTEPEVPEPDTLLPFVTDWHDNYQPTGYASYVTTVILPHSRPSMSLFIPDFYSSYELYVNGVLFSNNGKVADNKDQYIPKWLSITRPLGKFESDTLQLVLHIANFDHHRGGAYSPIKIGSSQTLHRKQFLDYGYSFILTGSLLMGGMFFLGLYIFWTS